MASARTEFETCSICGRGILRGERTYDYATPAGETRSVCALCRPSAEHAGWVPPDRLDSVSRPGHERRSRLGGRLGRLSEKVRSRADGLRAPAAEDRGSPAPSTPSEPERRPALPADPIARALAVFNAGEMPRMIAGLTRSLGEAKAEVRRDGEVVIVTVAWELSWYSWEISGLDVRPAGKGAEVAERPGPPPRWNAWIKADGRLDLAASA